MARGGSRQRAAQGVGDEAVTPHTTDAGNVDGHDVASDPARIDRHVAPGVDVIPELTEPGLDHRLGKHCVAVAQVGSLAGCTEPHRSAQCVADRALEVGAVSAVRDEQEPRSPDLERTVVAYDDLGGADEGVGDHAGHAYRRGTDTAPS